MKSVKYWKVVAALLAVVTRLGAVDLSEATTAELQAAFQSGTLTAEGLTELYLARIAAYDQNGPRINALIALNQSALATARELDAERKANGPRSPLHGVPFIVKDNYDCADMPTTVGSQLLEGWVPRTDAFLVRRLRDAGAILLAKSNLSEFAAGGSIGLPPGVPSPPTGFSSAGGQTRNPHDLTRHPGSSSGGTAAGLAAVFAQFGLGSDSGGSIRGPSAATGIVGLKPTNGLLSRTGIVPLAPTFDTGGPMARHVYDVAVAMSIMASPVSSDPSISAGRPDGLDTDYTQFLRRGALRGARLGVVREFTGKDPETDRVFAEALTKLEKLGAILIDVTYPDYLLRGREELFLTILRAEFPFHIAEYLAKTPPGYPKTLSELATRASEQESNYRSPEKAAGLRYTSSVALRIDDPEYLAIRDYGLKFMQAGLNSVFVANKLHAVVYPTDPRPPGPIVRPAGPPRSTQVESPSRIANLTGCPELAVPAGYTRDGLPVGLSFLAPSWCDGRLLGYGYDFEQASGRWIPPASTPARGGEEIGK